MQEYVGIHRNVEEAVELREDADLSKFGYSRHQYKAVGLIDVQIIAFDHFFKSINICCYGFEFGTHDQFFSKDTKNLAT
ncbi:hypothetical protein AwDysgo_13200 [Bacteroidales bacterium]|nr:hypothetical protein AwDysgo_13200 [Bacteroidales bacterium]